MEKTVFFSLDTFTFYQYCVDAISLESLPENLLTLVILEKYLKLSGVNFETAKCVGCEESNFTNISLKMHGFVCEKCDKEKNKYPPEVIKCFYYLFEEEYMKIEKFLTEGTYVQLIHLLKKYILDNLGIKISSL
jgi:recombinational DNA repair protein (RecF pathway)